MKRNPFCFLIFIFFLQFSCTASEDFKVIHQVAGPIETNCYLIYGIKSKEAALIDPGGPVDTLITFIKENELELKYIFVTHGHIDHVFGIPDIKNLFPKAKICMHKDEYRDLFTQKEWAIKNYGPSWLAEIKSNPETAKFLDFDMESLDKPDIFVEDNQVFRLGFMEIRAIHCPGHSPGGICYSTGNILFSGDVLFYRTAGRTDTQNGSRGDQIKSVRKLYELFPDSTIVYPGHGQFTDIGSEKKENKRIRVDGGDWVVQ
jgi:glyoxylase-like metal-dependent hydrolase (beta-lactamase superfamily II)